MNAISRTRPVWQSAILLATLGAALLAGCVAAPPATAPVRAAAALPPPPVAVRPAEAAPQPPPGWRDAAITPGLWTWSLSGGTSLARFGDGALALRCDPATHAVQLLLRTDARPTEGAGTADTAASGESVPISVDTTTLSRPLSGTPLAGAPPTIAVALAGDDPLLDAIAFSRGRFAVEAAGMATLRVPSAPEVARVIEDCR